MTPEQLKALEGQVFGARTLRKRLEYLDKQIAAVKAKTQGDKYPRRLDIDFSTGAHVCDEVTIDTDAGLHVDDAEALWDEVITFLETCRDNYQKQFDALEVKL